MPRFSTSLTEEQDEWVRQESERRNRSKADIVRLCIDMVRTGEVNSEPDTTGPVQSDVVNVGEYQEFADRVDELERRVDKLEPEGVETDTDATEPELIEYVQSNQPVSKSDIIAACYPSDSPLNERSWWDTRAREELKDAGYSYTRNVGWQLE